MQILKKLVEISSFRSGALSLLIQAQFVPLQLVIGIVLARLLGPSDFGIYSFSLALVSLIQVMPNNGLDNVVMRYSAQYQATKCWALLRGLWQAGLATAAAYGLITAAILAALAFSGLLRPSAAISPSVLAIAAIPMLFSPLTTFFSAAIRAVHSTNAGQIPQFVVKPWAYLIAILGVALITPGAVSAEVAMWIQGAAGLTVALASLYWFFRALPQGIMHSTSDYDVQRWLHSIIPLSLTGGLMLINTQADILMLGVLGTAHDTGLYKAASQGSNLVALSLAAANFYIAPRIVTMYTQRRYQDLQKLLSSSARSTFTLSFLIALAFWLDGSDLLRLVFGRAYSGAFPPLAILCFGQLINVSAGSVGLILNMTGNERDTALMASIAAVMNIALNAVLIPKFGNVGAATSTTVAMFIWNGLMFYKVRNKLGINPSIFRIKGKQRIAT